MLTKLYGKKWIQKKSENSFSMKMITGLYGKKWIQKNLQDF